MHWIRLDSAGYWGNGPSVPIPVLIELIDPFAIEHFLCIRQFSKQISPYFTFFDYYET
jgi:hypothetical protein